MVLEDVTELWVVLKIKEWVGGISVWFKAVLVLLSQ